MIELGGYVLVFTVGLLIGVIIGMLRMVYYFNKKYHLVLKDIKYIKHGKLKNK